MTATLPGLCSDCHTPLRVTLTEDSITTVTLAVTCATCRRRTEKTYILDAIAHIPAPPVTIPSNA